MSYGYTTLAALTAALLQRLQDSGGVYTTVAEAQLYLIEALRVLNCQTAGQNIDYEFSFNTGDTWKSLNISASPRQRTITDTQIYQEMQYHLLEPASGGTWTGTNQFNITNLSNALQFRRDELLQASGANPINITTINSPTMGVTTTLPDTVLDLRRVRWIAIDSSATTSSNSSGPNAPYALCREDIVSVDAYGDQLSLEPGAPDSWLITSTAPLTFNISCTPNVPGQWDLIAIESGASLNPPTATVLGLPNDWCWVAKYGALADALSNSPEATDQLRAKYCRTRYERGMKAMMSLPWLIDASIASQPVDTPSVEEMDSYEQNWENIHSANDPQIVVGGVDLIAVAPFNTSSTGFGQGYFGGGAGTPISAVLTLVGNAPITDPIQLPRDGVDAILAYAQHIAMLKAGGKLFTDTLPLYEQFEKYCRSQNRRYEALGIFRKEMIMEGNRGVEFDPRFSPEPKKEEKKNG